MNLILSSGKLELIEEIERLLLVENEEEFL